MMHGLKWSKKALEMFYGTANTFARPLLDTWKGSMMDVNKTFMCLQKKKKLQRAPLKL